MVSASLNGRHHVLWNRRIPIEDCFWSWDHTLHLLWASWRSQCKRTCSFHLCTGFCRCKDFLHMHRVNSSHQDGKSSASCMLGARNRSDLPKLPFGRCFHIEPRWELTWSKVSLKCKLRLPCLGSDRPPGVFQTLRILSQSCSTKPWRSQLSRFEVLNGYTKSYSMQPHQSQNPYCVRKWQSLPTWRSFFWVSLRFLPSNQYVAIEFPWIKYNDSNYPDWMMPWCFMHCVLWWSDFIRLLQNSLYSMDFASLESNLSVHSRTRCGPFQWSSPFEPATIHSKLPGVFPSTLVDRHNVDAFQGEITPFNSFLNDLIYFSLVCKC